MAGIQYRDIPSASAFRKDSSVAFAVRKDDQILMHLDWLLDRYEDRMDDWSLRRVILCDVFQTANFWIKSFHQGNAMMKKERYPAVLALFEVTVNKLCLLLNVGRGALALHIEEMFGRDNTPAGKSTDISKNAKYFDAKVREVFRIKFKGGLMYHNSPETGAPARLSLLNSRDYYEPVKRGLERAEASVNWAPFVMTLERVFYMTKHTLNKPGLPNIFHSAYTGGGTVSAAGTMLVEEGVLKGVRADSGHYKPQAVHMMSALQALAMFGVRLDDVTVLHFDGKPVGKAVEFIRDQAKWKNLVAAQADLRDQRGTSAPTPPIPMLRRAAPAPGPRPAGPAAPGSRPVSGADYNS